MTVCASHTANFKTEVNFYKLAL